MGTRACQGCAATRQSRQRGPPPDEGKPLPGVPGRGSQSGASHSNVLSSLATPPVLCYSHRIKGCEQDEYPPYADREWGAAIETPLAHEAAKTTWEPGPERPIRPQPNRSQYARPACPVNGRPRAASVNAPERVTRRNLGGTAECRPLAPGREVLFCWRSAIGDQRSAVRRTLAMSRLPIADRQSANREEQYHG